MFFLNSSIYSSANNGLKKRCVLCGVICFLIFISIGCSSSVEEPLIIGAAASLTNVMEELGPIFENETGISIKMSYASSGTLKQQIEDGAPIDVFISASQKKMEELVKNDKIVDVDNLLKNRIVFVVYETYCEKIKNPEDLIDTNYLLAIGEPDTVPAGRYAKEVLNSLNLWDKVEKQSVYGKSVRQVTDYLNQGEVSSGFIYRTDLAVMHAKNNHYPIPEELHTPIVYPVGIVEGSHQKEKASIFYRFLKGDSASHIFLKHGFELMD